MLERPSTIPLSSDSLTRSRAEKRLDPVGRERLGPLSEQARSRVLAREDLVRLSPGLQSAFGIEGLRRGSTVLIQGDKGTGATSLALALLACATSGGLWCSVVGPLDLGIVAGVELGVDLDRLVVVATPERRVATVLGALVDGCDVVLLRLPLALTRSEMLRLGARVRQRRVLLLLVRDTRSRVRAWAEAPDVTAVVQSSDFVGIAYGSGRIAARRVVIGTAHRWGGAAAPAVALWLPSLSGDLRVVDDETDGILTRGWIDKVDADGSMHGRPLRVVSP